MFTQGGLSTMCVLWNEAARSNLLGVMSMAKPSSAHDCKPSSCGRVDTLTLVHDRAQLLALQLEVQRLQNLATLNMATHGQQDPEGVCMDLVSSGAISRRLNESRKQLRLLTAIRDRMAAAAGTSSGGGKASGGRQRQQQQQQGSKAFAAAALDHVREWVQQQEASVVSLEELQQLASDDSDCSMLDCLMDDWREEREQGEAGPMHHFRAHAQPHASNSAGAVPGTSAPATPPAILTRLHRWDTPVAHFVAYVPHQLAHAVTLPDISYPSPLVGVPGHAAYPGVCWHAAPCITDPAGQHWRVACHNSLEQALQLAGDGDVVLLSPGRYQLYAEDAVLKRSIHIIGMGARHQDVVIYNNEKDDAFFECYADVQFENLTLTQLSGYDGVVQVHAGRTVLRDCSLQYTMSGAWVRHKGTLVMHNCKLSGGASSGIQVEATGTRLELYGSEVTQCGNGDDVVPRDLGAIDIQVRFTPLSASGLPVHGPLLAAENLKTLCDEHLAQQQQQQQQQQQANATAGEPTAGLPSPAPSTAPMTIADPGAAQQLLQQQQQLQQQLERLERLPEAEALAMMDAAVSTSMCQLDTPATVVVGPGCKLHGNKGFALSVVKPRTLALYHESLYQGGGGGTPAGAASPGSAGGGGAAGAGLAGAGSTGNGTGGGGVAPAMLAALEGTRVYVHGNVQLPGNSRGVLGVVDAEYTVLDGDEVNSRTSAKHFHAAQLSARQLRDGFCSRAADWSDVRRRCAQAEAAAAARKQRGATVGAAAEAAAAAHKTAQAALRKHLRAQRLGSTAAATAPATTVGSAGASSGATTGSSSHAPAQGMVQPVGPTSEGTMSALRVMVCKAFRRSRCAGCAECGRAIGGAAEGRGSSDVSSSSSSGDSDSDASSEDSWSTAESDDVREALAGGKAGPAAPGGVAGAAGAEATVFSGGAYQGQVGPRVVTKADEGQWPWGAKAPPGLKRAVQLPLGQAPAAVDTATSMPSQSPAQQQGQQGGGIDHAADLLATWVSGNGSAQARQETSGPDAVEEMLAGLLKAFSAAATSLKRNPDAQAAGASGTPLDTRHDHHASAGAAAATANAASSSVSGGVGPLGSAASASHRALPACWTCGAAPEQGLKQCSRCRRAYYCSPACQEQDWPTHKDICKPRASRSAKGLAEASAG